MKLFPKVIEINLQERKMMKDAAKHFLEKAIRLKEITEKYGVPLIINDNTFVAKEVDAFGIHVGNNDTRPVVLRENSFQNKTIGYSIEYLEQLMEVNDNHTLIEFIKQKIGYGIMADVSIQNDYDLVGIPILGSPMKREVAAISLKHVYSSTKIELFYDLLVSGTQVN